MPDRAVFAHPSDIKLKSENAALVKANDKLSTELDVLKVVIDKLSPRQEDKDKKPG